MLTTVANMATQALCNKTQRPIRMSWLRWAILVLLLSAGQSSKEKDLPKTFDDVHIGTEKGAIHVVSTTQCNGGYFTFQSWVQKYSLEMVSQPSKFTRVISCDRPDEISEEDLSYMDTMIVPDWGTHPTTGDDYTPYNRPVALIYWLAERRPTAEWTLILDPDMMLRQPFLLKDFEVPEGYAVAAYYNFMQGVHNELAEIHIPQVKPRQDEYGGPQGRKADMAGAFYLIRTKDLVKVAPLWLKYTEDLRSDPNTINYTGTKAQAGEKEWISEMYGYAFATAALGIWNKLESGTMYYPDYVPQEIPLVIHYGLNHTLGDYHFDKHEHMVFDSMRCPPWNMDFNRSQEDDGGLFPHPPFPDVVPELPPREKYSKLLVIDTVNTINQALCARHRKQCAPSVQLEKECGTVAAITKALNVEFEKLHGPGMICYDDYEDCKEIAKNGACDDRWGYTVLYCRASCNRCRAYIPRRNEINLAPKTNHDAKTESQNAQIQNLEKQNLKKQDFKNQAADSTEVLRCQMLDQKSFMADSKCRRLVRKGVLKLNLAQRGKFSFYQNSNPHFISDFTADSSFIIFAVCFVGLAILVRRYFINLRNRTPSKHQ